jgi:hypothetical protein
LKRGWPLRESVINFFSLDNKVAIVTGGNGGIGKGIARGLAGAGASIAIAARNKAKTDEAVAEIKRDFGVEVLGLSANMRKPTDIEEMVKQTADRFGRIDAVNPESRSCLGKGQYSGELHTTWIYRPGYFCRTEKECPRV